MLFIGGFSKVTVASTADRQQGALLLTSHSCQDDWLKSTLRKYFSRGDKTTTLHLLECGAGWESLREGRAYDQWKRWNDGRNMAWTCSSGSRNHLSLVRVSYLFVFLRRGSKQLRTGVPKVGSVFEFLLWNGRWVLRFPLSVEHPVT